MTIVVGLDVHREQITFDDLDLATGETTPGRIRPATREHLRAWLARYADKDVEAALEATTGWLFVVEELERVGIRAHLAEPAETRALRGRKKRAKTDRLDARHLRQLLQERRLPESWIPPAHLVELRTRARLRKTLVDERTAWQQRIHAQLFQQGVPRRRHLLQPQRRAELEHLPLPAAARQQVDTALAVIDALDEQLAPIEHDLRAFARRQAGCRALMADYGLGELTSVSIVSELGDARRFSSSPHAVRRAGLDVTVDESAGKRAAGKLSRQGPPLLRWALFEAAKLSARPNSPEHAYYLQAKARLGGNRACLAVARKLLRRAYHTLRALGEEALQPA